MSAPLMKSVSGIRGIVGETLTPELVNAVGRAFAAFVKGGTVVVGRDSRCTGEAISLGLQSALMLAGCDVVDIGIVPTPTVQLVVEELGAKGGIVISASHNPIEWNAFKLVGPSGLFLNEKEIAKFFALMDSGFRYPLWNKTGSLAKYDASHGLHIKKVCDVIDVKAVKKRKFKVVIDSVNGAGAVITPRLLEELGCTVVPLHCDCTGTFPRGAEPVPENLTMLSEKVRAAAADIGFAQDPDADRLAIVDEKGRPVGEERTLALVTEHLLSKQPGRVVINLSTTKTIEAIAARYGAKVKRTKVGEINVADEMRKRGARIGGEGNGGVISPEVHLGRDSLAGIVYVLEMLAVRKVTVSAAVASLPQYTMKKGKVGVTGNLDTAKLFDALRKEFNNEIITDIDGIRIDFVKHETFRDGWVHLRSSNTEPVFRIITEGRDMAQAEAIYRHFAGMIGRKQ
jgi:phosphomannomutase